MLRYPVSRAVATAAVVSSSETWKTPKPSWGMAIPLLSVTVGTVVDVVFIVGILCWVCVEGKAWVVTGTGTGESRGSWSFAYSPPRTRTATSSTSSPATVIAAPAQSGEV